MTRCAPVIVHAAATVLLAGSPPEAATGGDPRLQHSAPARVPDTHGASSFEFVGSRQCRMCHAHWYQSWAESAKGQSWEALRPGVAADPKRAAGLDVAQDYRTNSECLRCHSVGHGQRGGYDLPPDADRRAARAASERQGAGCEACHGPGSEYVRVMRDVLMSDRPYRREEMTDAGCAVVGPDVCLECHNREARCQAEQHRGVTDRQLSDRFRAAIEARQGFHARFPLKQRSEEQATAASSPPHDHDVSDTPLSADPRHIRTKQP